MIRHMLIDKKNVIRYSKQVYASLPFLHEDMIIDSW